MSKKNFLSFGDSETLFAEIAYRFTHLITGHRIKDKSGNAMTARDVLKVDGYLETTDDSTNAQTVISDAPTDITWAQYITMSAVEKQGKKWLIHDVPGICAKINAEMMSLLWENPSINSAFTAQNIALPSTDYNLFLVVFKVSKTAESSWDCTCILDPKSNETYYGSTFTRGLGTSYSRGINLSGSNMHFDVAYDGASQNNDYMIPRFIYGLKTTLDGTMFMMAEDLATSADKCMLSDGETSVGERVEANTFGTPRVDISNYTASAPYECPCDGYVYLEAQNTSDAYVMVGAKDSTNSTFSLFF